MTYDTEANKILSELKNVIAKFKQLHFTPEAIEDGEVKETQVVGCLISDYFDYDPEQIFEASRSAFEDVNYHSFNQEMLKIWNKDLSKSDES